MTSRFLNGSLAGGLLLGWMLACGGSAPDRTEPPAPSATPVTATPAREPSWQKVTSWTGSGIKETEGFNVASREWRIQWSATPANGPSLLQIYVHKDDGTMVNLAANHQGSGKDVSYVRSGPGRHYLSINSNANWTVTVEDQR